jgi:hypothetical protein
LEKQGTIDAMIINGRARIRKPIRCKTGDRELRPEYRLAKKGTIDAMIING